MTKITNFVWNSVDDCIISEVDETGAVQAAYTNEPQQYGRQQRGHPNWIDSSELEKYPTARQATSIELGKKSWHESIDVRFCRRVRFRLCIALIGA
ncbi:MAG: hypothetical protein DWI00_07400 [Planctomycetota bacterium]|nr:MAG: hypothetical protein DWI00_07400 [Planctomycetota bacterium]